MAEWLIDVDVFNHLGIDMAIETLGDGSVFHQEVLLDGRGRDLDVKGLVLDKDVCRMTCDVFAHHFGPCLDEFVLVVRCLYAVEAHELLND